MANGKFSYGMSFFMERQRENEASRERMNELYNIARQIQADVDAGKISREFVAELARQAKLNGRLLTITLEILGTLDNQQARMLYRTQPTG